MLPLNGKNSKSDGVSITLHPSGSVDNYELRSLTGLFLPQSRSFAAPKTVFVVMD